MRVIGRRMTNSPLEPVDHRSTLTANRTGRETFEAGQEAFGKMGEAFVGAGDAVSTISERWIGIDRGEANRIRQYTTGPTPF